MRILRLDVRVPLQPLSGEQQQELTNPAKHFIYTTSILPVHDNDLRNTPLLSAKAYHYLETPQDMQTRLSALLSLRNEAGEPDRPFIVWEPAPYVCKPENLQPCLSAAQHVDVLSPNHLELAALFGESPAKSSRQGHDRGLGAKSPRQRRRDRWERHCRRPRRRERECRGISRSASHVAAAVLSGWS